MVPFKGIVVLDFARGYPGAYTTMFLGDFGADVIRVDPPVSQILGQDNDRDEWAAYQTVYRNKRSIVIDLKSKGGQVILRKLVEKADVLLEGFRPGVMARLNADYETLKTENPRLIYCSLSGFGPDGPYASIPAHDMNYIALGGILSLIGQRDGPPYLPSNFIADIGGAALHGLVGILIALFAREKTGKGQLVDIAYLDSVISMLALEAPNYFRTGKVPRRGETGFTGRDPWTNVYKCRDGEYITVSCIEPHFWDNLCRAIGREDLIQYQRQPHPIEELDRVTAEIADIFITKTRDEWWQFFRDKETCFGPVQYLNEAFSDPQVLHRRMVVEVDHPKVGRVKQIGLPIKLSDTPGEIRSLGVSNGAHTKGILQELGYDDGEIEGFLNSGEVST
ncbi:MAG: CoA transferase [Dehalococcoidales bacterium]|nr:MAG: CoA transferase [Dehalococcoidales bacterium]